MTSKFELALSYFPTATAETASRHLRRWISNIPQLVNQLRDTGYQPTQHHLTAQQVSLIHEYLGEP